MDFYSRDLENVLRRYAKFPVVAVLGPRQSGKTTLAQHTFKKHIYLNLEDMDLLHEAKTDPKGMLRKYENEHGLIIDEFQYAPDLLSYIKVIVDEKKRPGYFVLTGSQNFLMNEAITQSLAGRVGILTLLPYSLHEMATNGLNKNSLPEQIMFRGGYPNVYNKFDPLEIYPSYIRTYLERDVRQLTNVVDLYTFQKFLKLCASRIGQLLNYTDLADNCGISVPTVHKWLSILEASYIIFLLRPHWNNFNKRITKTPKIYFYDTGIACSLLEIESEKSLAMSSMYGSLFECLIIADLYKQYFNQGRLGSLYFWRDKNGDIEIDCLISKDGLFIPLEIKSAETYHASFFSGTQSFSGDKGNLISWNKAGELIETIQKL